MDMNADRSVRRRVNSPFTDQSDIAPLLRQTHTINKLYHLEKLFVRRGKIRWYWAPVFLVFWILLYCKIAIPAFHRLPHPLSIKDEATHIERFIAERAELYLQKLVVLGPRVVGSSANEQAALKYFTNVFQELQAKTHAVHEIEADVQVASGSYAEWGMINMYQNIQNFIIKIGPKNSNSTSSGSLLVNSHFDSVPGSPGAGDDGVMVAVMLEVLRVISQSNKPLKHSVVFLFNGAEENPLQASHAFITQHKWAKNVKAVINLDSAGNGGREILFQSGPNHPWLMKLYRRAVVHPYASTIAEEMFQRQLIPSDTDFRIFRDYGRVPGLDMAHQYNGYVYHTRYDRSEIIPRGTLQSTGDNVLALIREIANASELADPTKYSEGHTVFFDIMGIFLIFYTEMEGVVLNIVVSLVAIVACGHSLQVMSINTGTRLRKVLRRLWYTFVVQVAAVIAAVTMCFFVAFLMDLMHMPMSWFTNASLIFGLYFCPLFFGLVFVPAIYFQFTRNDGFPLSYRVQLFLHSHCLFLSLLTIVLTWCGIRSTFMLMIAILFYTMGLITNLTTKMHDKLVSWLIPHVLCEIPPFLFYTYISHGFYVAFIPMTGRFGAAINPDLIICAFSVGVGILTAGFVVPLFNIFNKAKTVVTSLLALTMICMIIAALPLGFPYRPKTNVQRFSVLHTKRVFRDAHNEIRRTETGFLILPQDRRTYSVKNDVINMTLAQNVNVDCEKEMLCGLPLYNHRWHKARKSSIWIPGPSPLFNDLPQLKVISRSEISKIKLRFELELIGPDHMALFVLPKNGARITAWSFHNAPLRLRWQPPYFIYFSYGLRGDPLRFWFELERFSEESKTPSFEIGIGAHWTHDNLVYTDDFKKFLASFPEYTDVTSWPASYETWHF